MRRGVIAALVASTALVPVHGEGVAHLSFGVPADLGGATEWNGLEWALLVVRDADAGSMRFTTSGLSPLAAFNHSYSWTGWRDPVVAALETPHAEGHESLPVDATAIGGNTTVGSSSLLVVGSKLALSVGMPTRLVEQSLPWHALDQGLDQDPTPYREERASPQGVTGLANSIEPREVSLHGEGLCLLEFQGWDLICDRACPPSGSQRLTSIPVAAGGEVRVVRSTFTEIQAGDGAIRLEGQASFVAFGGRAVDLGIDGHMRLPRAAGEVECEACTLDGEKTLRASGSFLLQNTRFQADGRLAASVHGVATAAAVDEVPVTWRLRHVATDGALVAGTAGLVGIGLFALFTRFSKTQALENDNRKQLYDTILQNPGINFRELSRQSGIASGTARYHLTILARAKLIVEKPHHNLLRFFENHGKYEANWNQVGLLRDPGLKDLHQWLSSQGQVPQKDILNAMERRHSWSRSTTQHRLARLVSDGLVSVRSQGRLRMYAIAGTPAVADRPPGLRGFQPGVPIQSTA